jgi:O-antigen/teichoic acid export membrane protein
VSAVRSSLLLSAANSYVGLVLQVAGTAIIARILTPLEAGVFAVASVFAALGSTFRDFGVAEYLIQKKQVEPKDLQACFAVNLAASGLVGLLLLACAPAVGNFYGDPGVGAVMRVQALNFFLIPFGAVTLAWFRREMDFTPIFHASMASSLIQFVVSVGLAVRGHGYMALAWGSFAGVAITVVVAMWHRPKWFPRWPGLAGTSEVVHFGKFASSVFVAGQLSNGAPELTIGKLSGLADAGLYSRAVGVIGMFERLIGQAVAPVCLPYLARGVREQGTVVPSLSLTTTLVTGVGWPFVLFLALSAFPAVRIMYGPQWMAAVPVAQVLCVALAAEMIFRFGNQALFSLGKAREANRLQFIQLGLRLMGLSLVIPFGLMGAAAGLLLAAICGTFASAAALRNAAGYTWRHVWEACRKSLAVAALACAPYAIVVVFWSASEANFVRHFLVGAGLTALAWALAARALDHPVWPEVVRVAAGLLVRLRSCSGGASVK